MRAFTLRDLLVLIGILALLVAVRLPPLCGTETPVKLTRCLNNCRQMSQAMLLYRSDNNDAYPYGERVAYGYQVTNQTGWPMQLLRYMGGYKNVQPLVYVCPAETGIAENWVFQLHYQANRGFISDVDSTDSPIRGAQARNPAKYMLLMEKSPWDFANVKPGGLAVSLTTWNLAPGCPQYRRHHSGGFTAAAADGHVDWLQAPFYQPGRPAPDHFGELGDCSNGSNPGSTWLGRSPWPIKLYLRESQRGWEP